jgi:hypothetical protein
MKRKLKSNSFAAAMVKGDQDSDESGFFESDEKKPELKDPPLRMVFELNRPEFHFIAIGCLASLVSGAIQPAFAVVFSKATAV